MLGQRSASLADASSDPIPCPPHQAIKTKRSKDPELAEFEDLAKAVGLLKDWGRRFNQVQEMRGQARRKHQPAQRRGDAE